jgi:gamma-glutamylcyclotransferase (GGCT)/AIG2-like uncharacterized protein YtfP
MSTPLFVYGSLWVGTCPPAIAALAAACVYRCTPAFIYASLHDLGRYPAIRLRPRGSQRVYGELWHFHDAAFLHTLDHYEDYDPAVPLRSEYQRQQAVAFTPLGRGQRCWVYRYTAPCFRGRLVPGDYRRHRLTCRMRRHNP